MNKLARKYMDILAQSTYDDANKGYSHLKYIINQAKKEVLDDIEKVIFLRATIRVPKFDELKVKHLNTTNSNKENKESE